MSSTGVRRPRDTDSRLATSILDEERSQIESEKIFSETNIIAGNNGQGVSNQGTAAGNYLSKNGDTRGGPMGNEFSITTIASDTISVDLSSENYFPVVLLNGEGAADDSLSSITPGVEVFFHQELIVQAAVDNITLEENVLNTNPILTPGSNDVLLAPGEMAGLIYSALVSAWIVVWTSPGDGGGGGDVTEPIELGFNEVTTETPPTFTVIAGDVFNPSHVDLDQDITLQLDISATTSKYKSLFIIFDTTGAGFTVTWPASVLNAPVINDSAAQRISVILYTINNGTLWTHATSTGSANTNVTNQIAQLDTSVTVTDTGSNGNVITLIDSVQRFSIQSTSVSFAVADIFGLQTLNFDNSFGASTITPSSSGVIWNFPDNSNKLSVNFDDNDGIAISKDNTIFFSGTPLSVSAAIRLYRNETVGVPESGDAVGTVHFDGNNINDTLVEYSLINGGIRGVSLGSEEGSLVLQVMKAGQLANIVDIDSGEVIIDTLLNMSDNTISGVTDPTLAQDAATKQYVDDNAGIQNSIAQLNTSITITDTGSNGSVITLVDGAQKFSIDVDEANYSNIPLKGMTILEMHEPVGTTISTLTASLSGLVLDIESSNDVYDIQIGSVDAFHIDTLRTRILSTTPNTSNPLFSLFRDDPSPSNLDVVGKLVFEGRNDAAELIDYGNFGVGISDIADGVEKGFYFLNVPIVGIETQILRVENGAMRLRQISAVVGNSALLTLEKDNGSPGAGESIAKIEFQNNDDGDIFKYGAIQSLISVVEKAGLWKVQVMAEDVLQDAFLIQGNDNSTQFQFLMSSNGNTRMQPLSSSKMGYFVTSQATNFGTNLGTNGTLQIPQFSNGSPNLNALQTAAGAFNGAIIHDTNNGTLYIRNNSGQFDAYARTSTVT